MTANVGNIQRADMLGLDYAERLEGGEQGHFSKQLLQLLL